MVSTHFFGQYCRDRAQSPSTRAPAGLPTRVAECNVVGGMGVSTCWDPAVARQSLESTMFNRALNRHICGNLHALVRRYFALFVKFHMKSAYVKLSNWLVFLRPEEHMIKNNCSKSFGVSTPLSKFANVKLLDAMITGSSYGEEAERKQEKYFTYSVTELGPNLIVILGLAEM